MEKYTTPKAELVVLEMEDIIMASGVMGDDTNAIVLDPNELPTTSFH